MPAFLGIDAGGTGSRWACIDDSGSLLGRGQGPAIQLSQLDAREAAGRVAALLAAGAEVARGKVTATVAGLAGAGDPDRRHALRAALQEGGDRVRLAVVGDPEIAAAAALHEGPGVALWSGTGSFAVARGEDGRLVRVGGRGWLLGDEGSAFDLVRNAAIAASQAVDGLAPETSLVEGFATTLQLRDPARLGAALQESTPAAIAALLPVVVQAAQGGDGVALAVIDHGGARLARLARGAAVRAGLELRRLCVRTGGGVLDRLPELVQALAVALRDFAPGVDLGPATRDTATGAAQLARCWATNLRPMAGWIGDERSA